MTDESHQPDPGQLYNISTFTNSAGEQSNTQGENVPTTHAIIEHVGIVQEGDSASTNDVDDQCLTSVDNDSAPTSLSGDNVDLLTAFQAGVRETMRCIISTRLTFVLFN